jgi:cell wall-associated NlpC family hydrolase
MSAEDVVAQLRRELVHAFGWTSLELALDARADQRRLIAHGTAPTARTKRELVARLSRVLAPGWSLEASGVSEWRTGRHHALDRPARLWRALPGHAEPVLSSELEPEDGPVEVLASVGGAQLLRGIDATLGWTEEAVGEPTPPAQIAPARADAEALLAELEHWLGAPYLLGGTRPSGVDCSGLVQRCFRRALGVVLPRHSTDQLAFARGGAPGAANSGDLLFVWTEREGPCHVGVVRKGSVVHASVSRRRVLEDPLDDFTRGAGRVELVPLAELLGAHATFVGAPSIELPEREP